MWSARHDGNLVLCGPYYCRPHVAAPVLGPKAIVTQTAEQQWENLAKRPRKGGNWPIMGRSPLPPSKNSSRSANQLDSAGIGGQRLEDDFLAPSV